MAISNEVIIVMFGFLFNYLTLYKFSRLLGNILFIIISIVSLLNTTSNTMYAMSWVLLIISFIMFVNEAINIYSKQ